MAETEAVIEAEAVAEEDVPAAEERESADQLGPMEQAALAVREHVTVSPATMPTPNEWSAMRAMAETICKTEFVPRDFRDRPEAVLAAILSGRELGIGPMQSLKDISIIDGRPALAAHLVLGLLRKGGVEIMDSESTPLRARIVARRRDTGEVAEIEWTMEEAAKAQLAQKINFQKYPADMLWARCVGRLGRRLGSDILAGMPYTAEEVADFSDDLDAYESTPMVRGTIETHRVEGPGETPVPRSWPEIHERIERAFGSETTFDFWWFAKQMSLLLFSKEQRSDLSPDQAKVLGQKLSTATLKLLELVPRDVPPPVREEMQEAFASVLEGQELPGPPWSMSPADVKRGLPTREQWEAAQQEPDEPAQEEEETDGEVPGSDD